MSATADRTNFRLLAAHQIANRTGWIFKTESIVMPVVLDLIGGSGWLRGFLPMLSRIGQSVPPLLVSGWLGNARLKKLWVSVTALLMGAMFLILALLWRWVDGETPGWLPAAFLLVYAVFFVCVGIYQLALGTTHGKLVVFNRRGRLLLIANGIGSLVSIICAWFLLRMWLAPDEGNFTAIFATAGVMFMTSGLITFFLLERPDRQSAELPSIRQVLSNAVIALREDRQFRLLAIVAACFGMSMTLFPHYQALALQRLELDLTWLIPWLIAQNLGVGLLSIPAGGLADRFGNLLVVRLFLTLVCAAPLLALFLAGQGSVGATWFFVVFVLLGVTPITMRIFKNYTLELVEPARQPVYLSTLVMCLSLPPIATSFLVGWLIDVWDFEWTFGLVLLFVAAGWLLCWKLRDPRRTRKRLRPATNPPTS